MRTSGNLGEMVEEPAKEAGPKGSWMPPDLETLPATSVTDDAAGEMSNASAEPPNTPFSPSSAEEPAALDTDGPSVGSEAGQRREAVLVYCRTLLPPPADAEAAADALTAFDEARGPDTGDEGDPTDLLLAITRLMAAVSLPDRSTPGDRRKAVRASIGSESHCTCRESGALLAARCNGTIEDRGSRALDLHLAGCPLCCELADRLTVAETRFRQVIAAAAQNPT
jgi:hypothetical protein